MAIHVKTIGSSGQISLGKHHAGRTVTVEELQPGVWLLKTARVIPDNEMWLHTTEAKAKLDRALSWAARNPPRQTDLKALEHRVKKRAIRKTSRT